MSHDKAVTIQANANFHHTAGEDLFRRDDARFAEYRKRWKEWPETFFVGDFPLFLDIEVTSACNLKCPFCATTFRSDRIKKGLISFEMIKKVVDEGVDKGLCGIKFNIRGEPLLHPRIHEFVAYAKMKGLIDVYFNTNAMLLTEEVGHRLIDAGLDRLSISIEGYTKEVYERYRVGADFDVVLSHIAHLRSLKAKRGVDHPKIRVQTVLLPDLEAAFADYKKFWSERADEVAYLDYKEMKEKRSGVRYPWACPQLWQRMAVWWDGTILPCNHDDEGALALGNVRDTSVSSAWRSEQLERLRMLHKTGSAHTIAACDGCYLRDSEINKLMQKEGKL